MSIERRTSPLSTSLCGSFPTFPFFLHSFPPLFSVGNQQKAGKVKTPPKRDIFRALDGDPRRLLGVHASLKSSICSAIRKDHNLVLRGLPTCTRILAHNFESSSVPRRPVATDTRRRLYQSRREPISARA
jgi:hypothetical protein